MAAVKMHRSLQLSSRFLRILRAGSMNSARCYSSWRGRKPSREEDLEKLAASVDPGLRLGDYPVLPWRSAQEERPRGWWDDQDRRDKETPLHEEDDALNMWMFDQIENNGKYTRWEALTQLLVMFGILGGVYYLSYLYDAPSRNPAVPRQFPYNNLYIERGGDPANLPNNESSNQKKPLSTYGEFTS